MDFIKKKGKKTSNVVTVYLKDRDLESLEHLREMNVNVSMVCRQAIRDAAKKLMNGGDTSDENGRLVVKCNGKVTINMDERIFIFEKQKSFFDEQEFLIE